MSTEQEQLDVVKADVADLKIRMAVGETRMDKIESKLDKIEHNTSKILWTLFGTIALGLLQYWLSKGGHF